MEIVFFHRNGSLGAVSIQVSFHPIIEEMKKKNDVRVYTMPYYGSNPIHLLKNILFIRKHSSLHGINHITGDIHYGILGLIGRKSVLTIHDDYAIREARRGVLDKMYKWFFWIYLPIRLAKAPVCITPSTLKNIKKYYNSNKLLVFTHHSVPKILFPCNKPFNKKCPRILQIGTSYQKNLETTMKALSLVKCELIVLKEMSDEQKLMAKELGLNYSNRYNLPYEEVVAEYNKADIVVFPSLFEGLGVPIFEGQAAGKPVITTNKEPMNWVAGDGALLLRDPQNVEEYRHGLQKIIYDDDYRATLVRKGLLNAKRFSVDNAVDGYLRIYHEILNDRN